MKLALWPVLLPVALGCTPSGLGNGLQCVSSTAIDPMKRQPKYEPYAANPFFADHRAMRTPPEGAVAREDPSMLGPEATGTTSGGEYVQAFPVPVTRELLALGQERFNVFCAPCHGLVGDGVSVVARQMALRPPPSLVTPRAAAFPPGRVYQVATYGYGMMPSYRVELSQTERWAVTAYVHALAESQNARIAEVPEAVRTELGAGP